LILRRTLSWLALASRTAALLAAIGILFVAFRQSWPLWMPPLIYALVGFSVFAQLLALWLRKIGRTAEEPFKS